MFKILFFKRIRHNLWKKRYYTYRLYTNNSEKGSLDIGYYVMCVWYFENKILGMLIILLSFIKSVFKNVVIHVYMCGLNFVFFLYIITFLTTKQYIYSVWFILFTHFFPFCFPLRNYKYFKFFYIRYIIII